MFKNLFNKETIPYKELVKAGALIMDVRSPQEFGSGHIEGSVNIPLDDLQSSLIDLKRNRRAIITVCRSGTRSIMAQNILSAAGLEGYNGGPWNQLQKRLDLKAK